MLVQRIPPSRCESGHLPYKGRVYQQPPYSLFVKGGGEKPHRSAYCEAGFLIPVALLTNPQKSAIILCYLRARNNP